MSASGPAPALSQTVSRRRRYRPAGRTVLAVGASLALLGAAAAADRAPSGLAIVELSVGVHRIRAEVADNFLSRMQGLMHRTHLPANAGMLFVFDDESRHCMWMKNTLIPLSVAFLDDRGTVVNIADMEPHSEQPHCAARPVRLALEMNRGWFAARGVRPGMRIGGVEAVLRR